MAPSNIIQMKKTIIHLICILLISVSGSSALAQTEIYEITVYNLKSQQQIDATDQFLKNARLPAMHRLGVHMIGVFKPITNDTASIKRIFLIVPYGSLDAWYKMKQSLNEDTEFSEAAKSFSSADTGHLPYLRIESTLLEAFPSQPKLISTTLKSNPEAIYELRSYESPTEKLNRLKVDMFNRGDEIGLFKNLDFQALFYANVLSGSHMPNLIYMIAFPNLASRDAHWKAFGSSAQWKNISNDPQYQNNISVSHVDSYLLQRTGYSDL
jgi:NIPSNAP